MRSCRFCLWFSWFAHLIWNGSAGSNAQFAFRLHQAMCKAWSNLRSVMIRAITSPTKPHRTLKTILCQAFRKGIWIEHSVPSAFLEVVTWCACVLAALRNCEVQEWSRILLRCRAAGLQVRIQFDQLMIFDLSVQAGWRCKCHGACPEVFGNLNSAFVCARWAFHLKTTGINPLVWFLTVGQWSSPKPYLVNQSFF